MLSWLTVEYENPSAGKFEPPAAPPEPDDISVRRRRRLVYVLLLLSSWPVTSWLASFRGRGWAVAGAVLALMGVHLILSFTRTRDELDEKGPYSQPDSLTR